MFKKKIEKGPNCLDCHHPLHGENYCPNCGQLNNIRKPRFFELIRDVFSNLFSFDNKFFLSLKTLLTKPGQLSKLINAGQKTRYTLPIRMFLMMAILYIVSSNISKFVEDKNHFDTQQLYHDDELNLLKNIGDSTQRENPFIKGAEQSDIAKIMAEAWDNPTLSTDSALMEIGIKNTFINRFIYYKTVQLGKLNTREFNHFIRSQILIIHLTFVPILAFLLNLSFIRRREMFYLDHFTFAVHTQTLILFLLTLYNLTSIVSDNGIFIIIPVLYFLIYQVIAFKRFYQLSVLKTWLLFPLINIIIAFISIIFLFLVLIISFIVF